MNTHRAQYRLDKPAVYCFKLLGHLDQDWADTLGNLELRIEHTEEGVPITLLRGEVVDQAALHGLLQTFRDLGLVLLQVQYVQP